MNQITTVTPLLNEVLSHHYNLPCYGIIYSRVYSNSKRYQEVYMLLMTIINLFFLLFNKKLLFPTIIVVVIPMIALTLKQHMILHKHVLLLHFCFITIAFCLSLINLCHVMFTINCILSAIIMIIHIVMFDSSQIKTMF